MDELLTSLCSICHTSPPKYTCPACSASTCSVACVKRHKAWATCSGVRDPTAYTPLRRLQTPAGIDHDYNFLFRLETEKRRTEADILDSPARLIEPHSLHDAAPLVYTNLKKRRTASGAVVTKLVREEQTAPELAAAAAEAKKRLPAIRQGRTRKEVERLGVDVRFAPLGMSRSKENKTAWVGNKLGLVWTVEWLFLPDERKDGADDDDESRPDVEIQRVVCKAPSKLPLREVYQKAAAQRKRAKGVAGERKSASEAQPTDSEPEAKLYLHQPPSGTRLDKDRILVPVECASTLEELLPGQSIIEYPTIYVTRGTSGLPAGFGLGQLAPRPQVPQDIEGNGFEIAERGGAVMGNASPAGSSRPLIEEVEEGEVATANAFSGNVVPPKVGDRANLEFVEPPRALLALESLVGKALGGDSDTSSVLSSSSESESSSDSEEEG